MQNVHRFCEIMANEGLKEAMKSMYGYLKRQGIKQIGHLRNRLDRIYYQLKYGKAAPEPYRIIYIDPNEVDWMLIPRFLKSKHRKSVICSGEWDKIYSDEPSHKLRFYRNKAEMEPRLVSIENFTLYQSFRSHFVDGIPWEETKIYHVLLDTDQSSRYTSENAIKKRFVKIDQLFNHIKEHGYMSQRELVENPNAPLSQNIHTSRYPPEHHEVWIHLGRGGEPIFCTGQHRFSIARTLGIERIPVKVHIRHKIWQDIRYRILNERDVDSPHAKHPDVKYLIKDSFRF